MVSAWQAEKNLKHKHKFRFWAGERLFECYARTEMEQKVWVKTFSRVVDFNNGLSAEISAIKSPYYQTILDKAKERQATICEYNLPDKFIGTRKDADGYEEYVS